MDIISDCAISGLKMWHGDDVIKFLGGRVTEILNMNYGSETEKRQIVLRLFDRKFAFYADDSSAEKCVKIRNEAKSMLDNLDSFEGERVLDAVGEFLKNSLVGIIGEENVLVLDECCGMTVTELAGILCYAISEVASVFADDNGERADG